MNKKPDIHRLAPMLENAGLSEDKHQEFFDGVNSFTTMMAVLLRANKDGAPNYITFALETPEEEKYELTIRRSEGKTPCETIDEKDAEIQRLRKHLAQWLPEELGTVVARIRGKHGRDAIRGLHEEIGPILDDLDVAYQKWLKEKP